jgi:hypothetical protein
MTGSVLAAVVTPIVAFLALAAWLALVFWADAHPPGEARRAQAARAEHESSAFQETAEEPSRTDRRAA